MVVGVTSGIGLGTKYSWYCSLERSDVSFLEPTRYLLNMSLPVGLIVSLMCVHAACPVIQREPQCFHGLATRHVLDQGPEVVYHALRFLTCAGNVHTKAERKAPTWRVYCQTGHTWTVLLH